MKTREQMLAERARDRLLAEAGAVVGCLDGVDLTGERVRLARLDLRGGLREVRRYVDPDALVEVRRG